MIINANALHLPIASESVQCIVTSPPYYGLRDYGVNGQIGLEQTPAEYVANIVAVFAECWRVLRPDGVAWLNLGDSYATHASGSKSRSHNFRSPEIAAENGIGTINKPTAEAMGMKEKDLIGIPWRVAFALQAAGWWLRQDIIWSKPNGMPESVTDRCTKAHEYVFLLTKSARYFYDNDAIMEESTGSTTGAGASFKRTGSKRGESICPNSPVPTHRENREMVPYDGPTRNKRSVWNIATRPFSGAHFACMPPELAEVCIKAGSKRGDLVFDPFAGSGTTGMVAVKLGRQFVGTELNYKYIRDVVPLRMKGGIQVEML